MIDDDPQARSSAKPGTDDSASTLWHTFISVAMTHPQTIPLPGYTTSVFSAPSPERSGPNEDAAAVVPIDKNTCVLAVADGVGGQPSGNKASQIAIEELTRSLASHTATTLRPGIIDGIENANQRILEDGGGSATTVVVVELCENTLRSYHVGDSMLAVMGQRGRKKLLTVPHSPVGYAVEAGMLSEEQAMVHPQRHLVSNLVGIADMRIEVGPPIELAPYDTLVLASDGLFDNFLFSEITERTRKGSLETAAKVLLRDAQQRMTNPRPGEPSKPDDLTFVICRRQRSSDR